MDRRLVTLLLCYFHSHRTLVFFFFGKLPLCTQLPWLPPSLAVCLRGDNLRKQTSLCGFLQARRLLCLTLIFGHGFTCLASFFAAVFLVDFSKKTVFLKGCYSFPELLGDPGGIGLSAPWSLSFLPFPTPPALPLSSLRSPQGAPSQLFICVCSVGYI